MNKIIELKKQSQLAEHFRQLHHQEEPLILMNSWDCTSAKIAEASGFQAIATSSAGVAWALGYRDGEHIPADRMLQAVGRIAQCVNLPVSADLEACYFMELPEQFSKFIAAVIDMGIIGLNLEDTNHRTGTFNDLTAQVDLIKRARQVADEKGVPLFINARTDGMELVEGDLDKKVEVCVARAEAYTAAGADGIFVPFVSDLEAIQQLKEAISLPLNILMSEGLGLQRLRTLKVNRISVGSKPMVATLSHLKKIAKQMLKGDDWSALMVKDTNYPEINNFFTPNKD